ncbi:hypothetical protein [Uliginosibacterium sp. H1]|uniref:hypothetical protein n=1 Tax=Uliginosibacterium sp. H1 TaxID=3114757 RepID=UPI002E19B05A|nr:hypothetical protein [Uliginosibacterium sp. H1]
MTLKTTALALAMTAVLAACASSGSNTQSASSTPAPAPSSTSSASSSSSSASTAPAAKPAASTASTGTASSTAAAPAAATTSPDSGRRGINRFPLQDVLTGPDASKFNGVKLYFGNQKTPVVAQKFGEDRTSVRTNSVNKTAKHACGIALASALIRFQDAARRKGADAVVNIRSNYDNIEFSSPTEFECAEGALMAGVALKGDFVKLK